MDRERNTLSVLTDRAIKAGRPIYLDYAPFPSYFYLLRHGFVPISNIHDCLLVSLPPTPPSPLLDRLLRSLGFPGADAVCLDVTRFLNDRALAFFRLRDASETQLRRCLDYYETKVRSRGDWESVEVRRCALDDWSEDSKRHWDAETPVLRRQLREHLERVRRGFSTSIARDQLELRRSGTERGATTGAAMARGEKAPAGPRHRSPARAATADRGDAALQEVGEGEA